MSDNHDYIELLINSAKLYMEAGIKVLPCVNRKPIIKWAQYTYTIDDLRPALLISDSIGILTGEKFTVIDCDNLEAITWVNENIKASNITVVTERGVHFYYRGSAARNSASKMGVDLRGVGGFVTAPPTIKKNKVEYRVNADYGFGTDNDLTSLIEAISLNELPELTSDEINKIRSLESVNNGKDKKQSTTEWTKTSIIGHDGNFDIDMDHVKDKDSYLDLEGEVLAEGEGRNSRAAKLTGLYIADGLSKYEIMVRLNSWNDTMAAPLSFNELTTTMESIVSSHERNHSVSIKHDPLPPIELDPEERIEIEPTPLPAAKKKDKKSLKDYEFTPSGILAIESPKCDDFLPDGLLFRECLFMLTGEAKTFKSFVVLDLLISAATGGTWLGYKFSRPLKVYYLQVEVKGRFLKNRLRGIIDNMTSAEVMLLEQNMIITADSKKKISLSGVDEDGLPPFSTRELIEDISRFEPDIFAIDPLGKVICVEDDNKASNMEPVMDTLLWAASSLKAAIVLVHHSGKGSKGKGMQAMRGSSVLANAYDVGLSLTRESAEPIVDISVHNRNGKEIEGVRFQLSENLILKRSYLSDDEIKSGKRSDNQDLIDMSAGISKIDRVPTKDMIEVALLYVTENGFNDELTEDNIEEFIDLAVDKNDSVSRELLFLMARKIAPMIDLSVALNKGLVNLIATGRIKSNGGSYPHDIFTINKG